MNVHDVNDEDENKKKNEWKIESDVKDKKTFSNFSRFACNLVPLWVVIAFGEWQALKTNNESEQRS